ncbi:MAG: hypothetical protein QNI85_02815 [Desulfobacterales bacterium]|nr:hypothetical protein [Desulfobacterales bacterium]
MGKNSLLKSTSKKKPKAKAAKGKAAKKVAAPKSKAKAKPKRRPAKPAKKAPAKVAKTAAKKKAPAAKKTPKKLTRKELLFKQFDSPPATGLYSPPAKTDDTGGEAPSYFAGMSDPATAQKALQRKFDWGQIKAAGEQYAVRMAEEEAKRKAEEEAQRKAEEEAKRKAEEEAKRKAEEEAQRKAEEEAQRKAEEEAKRKAEEEAQRKAEEEAQRKAEEEAQRKAEEEARRKAEEEAQRKAEEEAQRKAEEDAKRRAEEDAKRRAEEEARLKAEIAAAAPPPGDITAESGGNKPLKFGLVAFGAILLLLIMSSYTNTKKYYITEKDGTVTIQRGTFTPMGTTVLISMTDVPMPEPAQDVYGWQDAYRLMYQHYINAADKLLEAPGIPDAAALATQLGMAVKYAPDRELRDDARSRLVGMRVQVLVHKAQAAMQRRTIEGVQVALAFLEEAADLDLSEGEAALVDQRTAEAEKLMADLEAAQAEAERQAAEEAALAAEAQKLKATAASSQAAVTDDTH